MQSKHLNADLFDVLLPKANLQRGEQIVVLNDINGSPGNDVRNGTDGDDNIFGLAGNDVLSGGAGMDMIDGGTGNDTLNGDAGDDELLGGRDNDVINGGTGHDYLEGNEGSDRLNGGSGLDTLMGGEGKDTLFGGEGRDHLVGEGGTDRLVGGLGNDQYVIDSPDDVIVEDSKNAGIDQVEVDGDFSYTLGSSLEWLVIVSDATVDGTGNAEKNLIVGGSGQNTLRGLAGNDFIRGDAGSDQIVGGTGDDVLFGDFDNDILTGGAGYDRFSFNGPAFDGVDRIKDFNVAEDIIGVLVPGYDDPAFDFGDGGLTSKAFITAAQFHTGAAAADASDRFIYDSTTGNLLFDVDGTGSSAAVQIARLTPGLALSHQNIYGYGDQNELKNVIPGEITSSSTPVI